MSSVLIGNVVFDKRENGPSKGTRINYFVERSSSIIFPIGEKDTLVYRATLFFK